MKPRRLRPPYAILRLFAFENRVVPSGAVELLSRADPTMPDDAAGGESQLEIVGFGAKVFVDHRLISADGRYVAYTSTAPNLVPGQVDGNVAADIFRFDRVTGSVTLVSHAAGAALKTANAASHNPTMSADGRYVAYHSTASDLVAGFTAGGSGWITNVFLFDAVTGTTQLVSHAHMSSAIGGTGPSDAPVISADGRTVAFSSTARNLTGNFYPATIAIDYTNVFVYDRDSATTSLLTTHYLDGNRASMDTSYVQSISDDGQAVGFVSHGVQLSPLDSGGQQVFVHNRITGKNELLTPSVQNPGKSGAGASDFIRLSADGRYAAFASHATDVVATFVDANGKDASDVYVHDRLAGTTTLVSHATASPTTGGDGNSFWPSISADGSRIAFQSGATDLTGTFTDGNGEEQDIFLHDRVNGATTLVSRAVGGVGGGGDRHSQWPTLSRDGSTVAYTSYATDLVAGFVDNNADPGFDGTCFDLYAYDRQSQATVLLNARAGTSTQGANAGTQPGVYISADGRYIASASRAFDLVAGINDRNGREDVYVADRLTGAVTLASARAGPPSLSGSFVSKPALSWWSSVDAGARQLNVSADGRFLAYTSLATNLVGGVADINQATDVFLLDRQTGLATLVSRAHSGPSTGNAGSRNPVLSKNGRFVAYQSFATDLITGFIDGNGPEEQDLFLFDRMTGTTVLVSHSLAGTTVGGSRASGENNYTDNPSVYNISDDGRVVAYVSWAFDLVDATYGGLMNVFAFDRLSGVNRLVSASSADPTAAGDWSSHQVALSGDGRYVAFTSEATNLMPGVGGGNVFIFNLAAGQIELVSRKANTTGGQANGYSDCPQISVDGRYVTFSSIAGNLVSGGVDNSIWADVFQFDRVSGTNTLVSHSVQSPVAAADSASDSHVMSADGRFVAFMSAASDLVAGFVDNNGKSVTYPTTTNTDVYLFDRLTGQVTLVSRSTAAGNAGGNELSSYPSISGDGRFVAFFSPARDLVPGFGGGNTDYVFNVFVFDGRTGLMQLASRTAAGPVTGGNADSYTYSLDHDGSTVVFGSTADDLMAGDRNGSPDIFAYFTPPPRVQTVTIADGSPQRSVIRSLTLTFDQPVFFAGDPAAAFVLSGSAGSVQLAAGSVIGNSVTLTFTGPLTQFGSLIDGKYTLRVLANQISNIGPLDGNNDGAGGDDCTFAFHRLFGDADGNGSVDALDFRAFRAAFGSPSFVFDLDNDGDVDAGDFAAFRGRFGTSV